MLGLLLLTGIFLVERLAGWVTITGTATSGSGIPFALALGASLFLFGIVGIIEELDFRGYLLKNLAEGSTDDHRSRWVVEKAPCRSPRWSRPWLTR